VGFRVDVERLRLRLREVRRDALDLNEAWVRIDGLSRLESFAAVSSACAVWDTGCWVYPTAGGTLVWFSLKVWRERVVELGARLEAAGFSGSVSIPPFSRNDSHSRPEVVASGMLMVHRMEPAFWDSPRNDAHVRPFLWGVSEETTDMLAERVPDWVLAPDYRGTVGQLSRIRVGIEDGPDLFVMGLPKPMDDYPRPALSGWDHDNEFVRREVRLSYWGRSTWFDAAEAPNPVERATRLADQLVAFASGLTCGFITATTHKEATDPGEFDTLRLGWGGTPDPWDQYVPDAFGIQLVSSAHLDKAHDLTDWQVQQVAPDRHLITAADLSAWYDSPTCLDILTRAFPAPELREKARHDFGAMILTEEVRRAYRLTAQR